MRPTRHGRALWIDGARKDKAMKKKINLIAALEEMLHSTNLQTEEAPEAMGPDWDAPVDPALLYDFLLGALSADEMRDVEQNLEESREWREALEELRAGIEKSKGIDIARGPKRAAAPGDLIHIDTAGQMYRVTFRPNRDAPHRGVLLVEAREHSVEGRSLSLYDASGQCLVRGKIVGGIVSSHIADVRQIQFDRLMVVAL